MDGNITGSFPSLKNRQSVQYESNIERDFLFFLEYDQTILRYEMQPLVITGIDATGKPQTYTPDVLIIRKTSRELVGCKPAAQINDARTGSVTIYHAPEPNHFYGVRQLFFIRDLSWNLAHEQIGKAYGY